MIIRMNLLKTLFTLFFILATSLCRSTSWAGDVEIIGPEVNFEENYIYVSTSLSLNEKSLEELRNGVTKEIKFTVDLFRVWKLWPDEFISGKSFVRTLKSDPVTMEYRATSHDGSSLTQKKFKSFESMLQWALFIENLKLANSRDLEKGMYFVRVTVESKIRKLPPVIGYFMIFLPENEFKIQKDSSQFTAGVRR